jgi:hypothetical protein
LKKDYKPCLLGKYDNHVFAFQPTNIFQTGGMHVILYLIYSNFNANYQQIIAFNGLIMEWYSGSANIANDEWLSTKSLMEYGESAKSKLIQNWSPCPHGQF